MTLSQAREAIDRIDRELVNLTVQRLGMVDEISDYKVIHNLPVHDPAREDQVISRIISVCEEGFREDIAALYLCLFEISRKRHEHRRGGPWGGNPIRSAVFQYPSECDQHTGIQPR